MKLYHTGREEIREPDIRRGRRNADFGQGFYLTPDREFARRWAGPDAVVNEYELDTDGNRIAGRTCWATYIADRVYVEDNQGNKKILVPRKGWQLTWTDIDGKPQKMFVVYAEPDKTIGWTRLFMAVQLAKETA